MNAKSQRGKGFPCAVHCQAAPHKSNASFTTDISMEDAPRPKRRRTDAADADSPPPLVRSEAYWFDDGNIILQVESTQFRLPKSLLSMHSSVFRDLFTLPLPKDEPRIENCPVVVLSGDTVEDWVLFLGVLYPKAYTDEAPTVALLAAMLRLAKKYDVEVFRKDCVRRLKTQFPTTLTEFDTISRLRWTVVKYEISNYPALVSLAREIGLHSILPALYGDILTGGQYFVGKLLRQGGGYSAEDRLACLTGYGTLLAQQSSSTLAWLENMDDPPSLDCRQRTKCVAALKEVALNFFAEGPKVWAIRQWDEDWEVGLCSVCTKTAKEVFNEGRKECWDDLPGAFGLPGWEDLKALDFE
ncbi:hypothetical protein C8R46DRAFT_333518 [Mycena filopes]|nr:hypothetical protein C8R46DRAFT_333518 [Mycena filopes]